MLVCRQAYCELVEVFATQQQQQQQQQQRAGDINMKRAGAHQEVGGLAEEVDDHGVQLVLGDDLLAEQRQTLEEVLVLRLGAQPANPNSELC